MHPNTDYYNTLGVSREAATLEIKHAFEKLAAAFHAAGKPRNIDDVEEIRRYVTAYRVLSDPKKRQYYDKTGFRPLDAELTMVTRPFPSGEFSERNGWADVAEMLVDFGFDFSGLF